MTVDDEGDVEDGQSDESVGEIVDKQETIRSDNVPYKRIFDDLDKVFEEVTQDLTKLNFNESVKNAQKAIDHNQTLIKMEKKKSKRRVREYVDICQDDPDQLERLEDLTVSLVLKLK